MKPIDTIKQTFVKQGFSQPVKNLEEKLIDDELEGQQYGGKEEEDLLTYIWLVDVNIIKDRYIKEYQPTFYYLDGGPKRSFVFEELQPIQDP